MAKSRQTRNKDSRNGNRGNHGRPQGHNKYHGRRNRDDDDYSDYGIVACTTLDLSQVPGELSRSALESDHDLTWTVDSGCTGHATSTPKWFKTLKPTAGKAITIGGNHQIPIEGTGDVEMKLKDIKGKERSIALNDVLYAPDLKFNLTSVRQTVGNDFKINFPNAKKCVLFFAHRIKFEAKTGDGKSLYQFQPKPTDSDQEGNVATSGTSDNVMLWHKQMAHPNFRIMQDLAKASTVTNMGLSNFHLKQDYFSSTCTYAKSHRNPFNKRTIEKAKFPLEKVHTDTGPLPVPTLSGCQYFLTFIDDYIRYMFIYVIKRKSDLYESYENFRKKTNNIFRAEGGEVHYHENKYFRAENLPDCNETT
ncbi:hypothetical protein ON010_g6804 [Phytophthora cinnamomi]|nr:hypothetical protein ON010_g6804 [Phytophthora cinnamomi]